jgi:hypothetical protein
MYMEILQGNYLCGYLYLKLVKMSYFSFYPFLFCKIRKQEEGLAPVREGRWWGNRVGE